MSVRSDPCPLRLVEPLAAQLLDAIPQLRRLVELQPQPHPVLARVDRIRQPHQGAPLPPTPPRIRRETPHTPPPQALFPCPSGDSRYCGDNRALGRRGHGEGADLSGPERRRRYLVFQLPFQVFPERPSFHW